MIPAEDWTAQDWATFWSGVAALASVVSVITVILAVIFAFHQVREASRARQLGSALAILQLLDSTEYRNARRFVYRHHKALADFLACARSLEDEDIDNFLINITNGKVDLACLQSYLASLEHTAILVLHDLGPDDLVDMYFGRMVPHHWNVLQPLIHLMRKLYETDDFLQHFEMLNTLITMHGLRTSRVVRNPVAWRLMNVTTSSRSVRLKHDLLNKRRISRNADLNQDVGGNKQPRD